MCDHSMPEWSKVMPKKMEKEVLDQDILQKQAREKYTISEKVS